MQETPFHTVFLHAMVRDHDGHKMSKVKGNVIDPLDIIYGINLDDLVAKRHQDGKSLGLDDIQIKRIENASREQFPKGISASGADALRFFLVAMAGQGRNINLDANRIEGFRFFANKIWNASRFALMNLSDFNPQKPLASDGLGLPEKWILHRLGIAVKSVNAFLADYHFDRAAMSIYQFLRGDFCDWFIELCKPILCNKEFENHERRHAMQHTLVRCLDNALKLLHPIMPFITEELWQKLPKLQEEPDSIMIARYPAVAEFTDTEKFGDEAQSMESLMELIKAVRNIRGELNIDPGQKIPLVVCSNDLLFMELVQKEDQLMMTLAKVNQLLVVNHYERKGVVASGGCPGAELFIPLSDLIDREEERRRISRKLVKTLKELDAAENKLKNDGFLKGAPEKVVAKVRDRRRKLRFKVDKLRCNLKTPGST